MDIRHMAPDDDKAAISHIYEASWRSAYCGILPQDYLDSIPAGHWIPYLEQAGRNVLVMEAETQLIGTASYCTSRDPSLPEYGEVVSIYLLPAWQGMGYGRLLLNAVVAQLATLGCQDIFLWVLEENHRARRFYEKAGFTPVQVFHTDTIGGKAVREIQYRRHLS